MRFKDKNNNGFYEGKRKGFKFTISFSQDHKGFYIVASHIKKDIRYNTLWTRNSFKTFDLAVSFCEQFNYKEYKCLGDDS